MKLKEILNIINGQEVYVADKSVFDIDFHGAFGTDLMSDALCHLRDSDETELLITGLSNMQIINTASTLDLQVILVVRGKPIDDHLIEGAKLSEISIFKTDFTMYQACGRLYEKGLGK